MLLFGFLFDDESIPSYTCFHLCILNSLRPITVTFDVFAQLNVRVCFFVVGRVRITIHVVVHISFEKKPSCGVVPFSDWPSNDSDALMLIRKAPIFSLLIILLCVPGDVLCGCHSIRPYPLLGI